MGLIFTNLIYSLFFFLLTTKELITDKYDHDIDQFMYFGSRILHGELIWTREFDDKSPIVQYIFSLPAALKDPNIFVVMTLIVSLIGAYLGFKMLKDILQNSGLEIGIRRENSILYFGTILYLTLLVCIYGSLHHINAISSSLCLITISITYLNREKKNKILTNISAITSAISISIRPYYLLNIIILPIWLRIREKSIITTKGEISKREVNLNFFKSQIKWILMITFYIILFNVTPYILSGELSAVINGIKLNSIDYVNHNIFQRQFINIGKNPILYPILIGIIILPLIRISFDKIIQNYYKKQKDGRIKLNILDTDIIFFGIVNPILLEIMFYKKHFFSHYFTLFSPYIYVSIVLLLAVSARINNLIYNYYTFRFTIKSIFLVSLIGCLITNQSLPNTFDEILNKNISSKSYKLKLLDDYFTKEKVKNKNVSFLAPNDNYIHWNLDESRHGFPQKAVFRNISNGKMDYLISKFKRLDYKFLLPEKKNLCKVLNKNAPEYIITQYNDYSFKCLQKKSSKYKLSTSNQTLNENNIYIFKKYNE